ncbi:MAG: ABC transporter permease [Bacteroidota bacterium]
MYKLFLKIATRYLLKNKLYSFINIFGLAIGITSFVLIMLYVNYERSYDAFEGSEHVYRTYMDYLEGDTYEAGDAMTYNASGPDLKREFPEILEYVRFFYFEKMTFTVGDRIFDQPMGSLADASYFKVFGYPLLKGDTANALREPNTIVLSESLAKKLFGDQDPIRKSLSAHWDGKETVLTVTGVMKDVPKNAHYRNNYLISFSTERTWGIFGKRQLEMNYDMNNYYTYLKLDRNTNADLLRQKIIDSDIEDNERERHNIEAIENIHLLSDKPYEVSVNGSATRIRFLTAIAFIVIILSWLNYVNLSTTKSLERAKETGIRKVVGAQRPQLVLQSLMESMIIGTIAFGIALVLTLVLLPIYNTFSGKDIAFGLTDIKGLLPILGCVLFGMLLAGMYPALLLSGYSPAKALKGKIRTSANGLHIRKGLIVTQFVATIALVVGTLVVTKQINYLQNQPIGAKLNQVVGIKGDVVTKKIDSLVINDFNFLKEELALFPFIEKATIAQTYPGDSFDNLSSTRGIGLPNGTWNQTDIFYTYHARPDYFDMVGIEFIEGRTFLPSASGSSNQVVVNETFLKEMGISAQDILNKNVTFWGNQEWVVTGIIKDYHHFGLKGNLLPILIRHQKEVHNVLVKLDATAMSMSGFSSAIKKIKAKWTEVFPKSTFNYTFLDQKFEAQYNEDKAFGTAFQVFTILAILIASLGLFGLTSYTVMQRKKEIGIRKVNGATIAQILTLLNTDFIKWVALAFVMAIPISWYAMEQWLQGFAYRTSMSWWIFALAGITALLIALLTVSWQSFQAATANPVDALKDE